MKDFLVTLCLGWLGVHRFMQKKYITGAIWFFTLGLCGIGWAIDTVIAFVKMLSGTQTTKSNGSSGGGYSPSRQFIKSFDTVIVGTFATCDLDENADTDREEVIASFKPNSRIYLQYWEYNGEPAYYVCCQGLDAGNVPATLAKILYKEYSECEFIVTLQGKAEYNNHDDLIQKIKIDVYR